MQKERERETHRDSYTLQDTINYPRPCVWLVEQAISAGWAEILLLRQQWGTSLPQPCFLCVRQSVLGVNLRSTLIIVMIFFLFFFSSFCTTYIQLTSQNGSMFSNFVSAEVYRMAAVENHISSLNPVWRTLDCYDKIYTCIVCICDIHSSAAELCKDWSPWLCNAVEVNGYTK